jgi:hypothetical protein
MNRGNAMKPRSRTHTRLAAALLAAVSAMPAASDHHTEEAVLSGMAKASVAAFASALKSELTAAMQSGGPVQAIEVCNKQAPAIAREVSLQQDVRIARVSLRNRNPGNAPNDWQRAVLESFEAQKAAGADPATLIWHEIADTDADSGGREFRFMQAIPTQPLCLACHGEALAPTVAAKVAELYPDDQATGFSEGDLRGAFVVTRSLD